jgi:Cdc6-like AAA superfamily ATPase
LEGPLNPIYKKYKERFIQISGRNRSLFLRDIVKKYSYDIGAVMETRSDTDEFLDFLWHGRRSFTLMDMKIASRMAKNCAPAEANTVAAAVAPAETAGNDETIEIKTKKARKPEADNICETLALQLGSLRYLKREEDELEKETGRAELYIGYPFVLGSLNPDTPVCAPLMLFPAMLEIGADEAEIRLVPNQPVMLNKAFILAYSKEKNLAVDKLIQEFDPLAEDAFSTVWDVAEYLQKNGFRLNIQKRKTLMHFEQPLSFPSEIFEVKNMAVLGRFPLANSIYNDYLALEKDNLSTPSIQALLSGRPQENPAPLKKLFLRTRKTPQNDSFYEINDLDFAQEGALAQIAKKDNIVIYGPPGTGKSQTIVNIISDALCKNKRVLVVSQKRAALDVVFNRLGRLNDKAMLIPDPEKEKLAFFERLRTMHVKSASTDYDETSRRHKNVEIDINREIAVLQSISDALFTERPFGLTLQEMYAASYNIGRESDDYKLYEKMKRTGILRRRYPELKEDIRLIKDKQLDILYLRHLNLVKENEMIVHILPDIDLHKLKQAKVFLADLLKKELVPFNTARYPYSRYLTTFYLEQAVADRASIRRVADIVTRMEHPTLSALLQASAFPLLWPLYPFLRIRYENYRENVKIDLHIGKEALENYESDYKLLSSVLDQKGYALAIGGLINGNANFLRKLLDALDNYVAVRDLNTEILSLSPQIRELLDFAYANSDGTAEGFRIVLEKIMPIRIYHEIVTDDGTADKLLAKTVVFDDLRNRISALQADKRELSRSLAMDSFSREYAEYFRTSPDAKDYLYEIQKQRGLKPIRVMFELFDNYLMRLFPCWLLSPEVVSTILPLKTGLFDLVVFDEASQIFIESAIPAIYRAQKVVVAGDNKQLRPTAGFVRRYFGDDSLANNGMDLSTQAALEVESLLDLAAARYYPVYLSYHYRSNYVELIDFSNAAFYENRLQIAPNISKNFEKAPIERIKVRGIWQNRHNHEEAVTVIKLLRTIFRERTEGESIGIVTFNVEQKEYIEDLLDEECAHNKTFARQLENEKNRIVNGENIGLFVKNLENVQGEERDIIIFSIGYAKNENDRIVAQYGSLSVEGGENRLNVAITRAKKKIYVITSIEPEELDKAETTKNNGPKLLRKYLQYARAVSENNTAEIRQLLLSMHSRNCEIDPVGAYEQQIKAALEKAGYEVDINLGNTDYKLSLGIYDKELGRYVLGIECDYQAFHNSESVLERDVYRFKFFEIRGWKIVRVWSRDWWLSPAKVLADLIATIEKQKKVLRTKMQKDA